MNDHELDTILRQMSGQPLPALPPTFRQDVWRAIRARTNSTQAPGWLRELLDVSTWMLSPRPAFAALALALATGVSGSWLTSQHASSRPDMSVFSTRAPGLYLGVRP